MAPENFDDVAATSADAVNAEFDLESVIAWFAGDDSCVSHALPTSLSPEQRQLAKKLVGCHPHLECESYGFGPERQLHLFRKRCKGVRMRVKNTFIDAWLDGGDGTLAPVSRSLPSSWRSMVVAALVAPVSNDCCEVIEDITQIVSTPSPCSSPKAQRFPNVPWFKGKCDSKCKADDDAAQLCSTTSPHKFTENAPSHIEVSCEDGGDTAHHMMCSTPSPCTSPTLLHFPNAPTCVKVHDPSGTELMASAKCALLSNEKGGAHAMGGGLRSIPLPPPPASPINVAMLSKGTEVEIDGLVARPDFNGLAGIIQSWDPVLRRYDVLLDPVGGGGPRHVKLKRENLRLNSLVPPPPGSAAILSTTIDLSSCLPKEDRIPFQHAGGADVLDATPLNANMPCDSPDWYSWQFCDPSMSPHSDPSMSPTSWHDAAKIDNDANMLSNMDQFGGAGAGWEYTMEGATWMQQPLCEAGFCTEWAA